MRGRHPMRQRFLGSKKQDQYVPNFHVYCYWCNKFGHRVADCRPMDKPPISFESRNSFAALWGMDVIYYQGNGFGHRSFECRKSQPVSYNSFKDSTLNVNIKCYNCQEFGHIEKHHKHKKIKQKQTTPDQKPVVKPKQEVAIEKKKEDIPIWVEKDKNKAESSLIVQTTLHVERRNLWVVDSGCSNHMTGDKKKFIKLEDYNGGSI